MITTFARIAVAGAAVATVFAGTASSALAAESGTLDTNKTISSDRGHMTYIDDGDMFSICDDKADGYGVKGQVERNRALPMAVLTITDGGDAGCDKGGVDITNSSDFRMVLTWNGGGLTVYSAWFNE